MATINWMKKKCKNNKNVACMGLIIDTENSNPSNSRYESL